MALLTEIANVTQVPGEPRRRWFTSDELDLIVWLEEAGAPAAFQLCYDKPRAEHALTWTPSHGFLHAAIDDGESVGLRHKATPILVADGDFSPNRLGERFAAASAELPPEIVEFVSAKLREHPGFVGSS